MTADLRNWLGVRSTARLKCMESLLDSHVLVWRHAGGGFELPCTVEAPRWDDCSEFRHGRDTRRWILMMACRFACENTPSLRRAGGVRKSSGSVRFYDLAGGAFGLV